MAATKATAVLIAVYLADIHEAFSIYMDDLVLREKLGHSDIFQHRVKATVLDCYVTIMDGYFSQPVYSGGLFLDDYNFFDVEEIEEVMLRINRICDSNIYIDL
jgi:hypothetical protein